MSKKDNAKIIERDLPITGSDDFASMLAAYDAPSRVRLQVGDKVRGKVFHISKEHVFVSLSASQEAVIPRSEIVDDAGHQQIVLGDSIEAFVVDTTDGIVLSRKLGREHQSADFLQRAVEQGMPVEGVVTGVNKGGLEVALGTVRAFCPLRQIDLDFVDDPQKFIGQTLQFRVTQVKDRGRDVVLSRRAILEVERAEKAAALRKSLEVGQVHTGTVSRVTHFGAFVDLGGMDGLIPIGELAHTRVAKVEDVVHVGDTVSVQIKSVEEDPKRTGQVRIGLSRKSTLDDPWDSQAATLTKGARVSGKVVRLEAFGAFVELATGITGLIHLSEMSSKRIAHPHDVVKLHEMVTVRVLSVDPTSRRIALSLKDEGSAIRLGAQRDHGDDDVAAVDIAQYNQSNSLGTLADLLQKNQRVGKPAKK